MLMLGLLVVRLRPPRPTLAHLSRQPGAVACVAVAATIAVNALELGAWTYFRTVRVAGTYNPYEPIYISRVAPALIAAWLVLWLGGRWRSETSTIDRLGRLLGLFWLLRTAWPWVNRYALH